MKMHFPISIMAETTCSQRDLHRHCFLILCLFLSCILPLCCVDHLLLPIHFPVQLIYIPHAFVFHVFAGRSQPQSCRVHVMDRSEYLKHFDESP